MKSFALALCLSSLILGETTMAQVLAPQSRPPPLLAQPPMPEFMKQPGVLGPRLFIYSEWEELEATVADYMKTDARGDDGRHALYLMTAGMGQQFGGWDEGEDGRMAIRLAQWQEAFPKSALQPIVAAMYAKTTAWRARGNGLSSSVTEEGWRLFRERNQRAWTMLMNSKEQSSSLPTWYEQAIDTGGDVGVPEHVLQALFEEGVRRYPGYYAIYFAHARQFFPRWGGTWETADEFIVEQTKSKNNKEGDVLYARLYWLADQYSGQTPEFFEDSRVNWPKMRRGFEQLMAAYPKGARNQASFAVFACRAKDATTYALLRPKIDFGHFRDVAPEGISVEICDTRFMKPA